METSRVMEERSMTNREASTLLKRAYIKMSADVLVESVLGNRPLADAVSKYAKAHELAISALDEKVVSAYTKTQISGPAGNGSVLALERTFNGRLVPTLVSGLNVRRNPVLFPYWAQLPDIPEE